MLRLLTHLTVQTARMMATMKKRMPPTTPAVTAFCFSRFDSVKVAFSLDACDVSVCALTRNTYFLPTSSFFTVGYNGFVFMLMLQLMHDWLL